MLSAASTCSVVYQDMVDSMQSTSTATIEVVLSSNQFKLFQIRFILSRDNRPTSSGQ